MLLVVGSRQLLQNMLSDMQSRKLLLDSLKGTKVVIPNLYEIFAGWPQGEVNPNYSRLTEVSARRLIREVSAYRSFLTGCGSSDSESIVASSMTGASSMPSKPQTSPSLPLHGGPKQTIKSSRCCCFSRSGSSSGMTKSTSRLVHTLATWQVLSSTARKRSILLTNALTCAFHLPSHQSSQRTRSLPVSETSASSWLKTIPEVDRMIKTTQTRTS
jgi:hypothetical protein